MKINFCFILLLVLAGCRRNNDYEKIFNDPNLYCGTVHELNTIVMGNNFSPMVASRNYLYAAVAGYEVIAAANPEKFNSLAGQLRWPSCYAESQAGSKNKLQSGSPAGLLQTGRIGHFSCRKYEILGG